jgi:hypothetical protein
MSLRGMVVVPLVEVRMHYISVVSKIRKLILMLRDLEGCDPRYEPSGKFWRVEWSMESTWEREGLSECEWYELHYLLVWLRSV